MEYEGTAYLIFRGGVTNQSLTHTLAAKLEIQLMKIMQVLEVPVVYTDQVGHAGHGVKVVVS